MKLILSLAPHAPIGSRKHTNGCIARAVGKERRGKQQLVAAFNIHRRHGSNFFSVHHHPYGTQTGIERDILLCFQKIFLFGILIKGRRLRIAAFFGTKFANQPAKSFVRTHFYVSAQMNTYLGTIVSSPNGTVIDKSHTKSETRGCNSGTHSRNTASNNHEIEFALSGSPRIQFFAPSCIALLLRYVIFMARYVNGIASSVEPCEIFQKKLMISAFQFGFSHMLPRPRIARIAGYAYSFTVHTDGKRTRTLA